FSDLRTLEVPDLRAEFLQGRREVREDRDELGVPVAPDDLGRGFLDADAEVAHHSGLDVLGVRSERRSRPDGAGHLADHDASGRLLETVPMPDDLRGKYRHLEADRDRAPAFTVRPAE